MKARIEAYLKAAAEHGRQSDPDAEGGDLQVTLMAAFEEMTAAQRAAWAARSEVAAVLDWAEES